jgi:translation initiation factor IF-3
VPEVRVIADDGSQLGVMPTYEALRSAEEKGLDLVEVSPKAVPPVCRIMDYGKFKYEQSKKTKQAKKTSTTIEIKEIKFRPKTDDHDYEFKVKHIRRFLEEGNKVRLVIAFRGREIVHPETGKAMLDFVIKDCLDIAHVEQMPMMDGRRMLMIVSPKLNMIRPAGATGSVPAAAPPGVVRPPVSGPVVVRPPVSSTVAPAAAPAAPAQAPPAPEEKKA